MRKKPRQMMEVRTEGRRGRGRPRMSYMDNIENQARERGKGMGELRRMARDRDEWRRWIQTDKGKRKKKIYIDITGLKCY